ncbi:MAG: hypothetical protein QG628_1012 [Patescibacteria group bacterium]|nr:hypothetical protein [Patescibacteria group bacterium]
MTEITELLLNLNIFIVISVIVIVIVSLFIILVLADYNRHKKPLRAIDPTIDYSLMHHLHVVTLPLFRYRLSIKISKANPLSKDGLHRF